MEDGAIDDAFSGARGRHVVLLHDNTASQSSKTTTHDRTDMSVFWVQTYLVQMFRNAAGRVLKKAAVEMNPLTMIIKQAVHRSAHVVLQLWVLEDHVRCGRYCLLATLPLDTAAGPASFSLLCMEQVGTQQ